MIHKVLVSHFMWMLFLTSLTGGVLTLVWYSLGKIFERAGFFNIVYHFLRVVSLFWIAPISFLVFTCLSGDSGNSWMIPSWQMIAAAVALCVVWLVGVVLSLIRFFRRQKRMRYMKRCAVSCDRLCYLEEFERICAELRIRKGRIRLMESCEAPGPCVVGLFRPMIILPEEPMTLKHMRMVILHELSHHKQKDLWLKYWAKLILFIHFLNPAAWWFCYLVERWSEYACDYRVCSLLGGFRDYFQTIFDMSFQTDGSAGELSMNLYKRKNELLDRVEHMDKIYGRKRKPRIVAALLTASMLILSTGSVFAASAGTSYLYGQMRQMTEGDELEGGDIEDEELVEFIDDGDESGLTVQQGDIDNIGGGISTYSTAKAFGWNIKNNYKMFTGTFTCYSGNYIIVTADITPANKYAYVGIIDPDGVQRAVYGKGTLCHRFELTKSGWYRVYVKNQSGVSISVTGTYIY